jgi:hypothetical protein
MARGEVGRVIPRRGTVLRVLRGRVWLTEYGGGPDWALGCGTARAISARGTAVIEATIPAVVEVLAPVPCWMLLREAAGRIVAGWMPIRMQKTSNSA